MKSRKQKKDEAQIRALVQSWSRAIEAKEADAAVEAYTPETVLFDVSAPYTGKDAVKAVWQRCFPFFPEKFKSQHRDLTVEVDGDLALVHGFHRFLTEPAGHPCGQFEMRVTVVLRRTGEEWHVLHEHVSIPFQMEGNASCTAETAKMSTAAKAAAEGVHRLSPHLVCANAVKAIDFYKQAFGADELVRLAGPDGKIMHACLSINGSSVMLTDENPSMCNNAPTTLKGTPVTIHLIVDDADAFAARAVEAGAKTLLPLADMFWGDRYGVIEDPFGHRWAVSTPKRVVRGKDLEAAAAAAIAEHKRRRAGNAATAQPSAG